jgi:hypothetical protein
MPKIEGQLVYDFGMFDSSDFRSCGLDLLVKRSFG